VARPGKTIKGEKWHECARSGFTFPESEMIKDNNGQWIAEKLSDPEDTEEADDSSGTSG